MQAFLMLAGVLALASMCLSIFLAFQSPRFVAGLAAIVVRAILPIILKRKSPADEKAFNDAVARGADMNQFARDQYFKKLDELRRVKKN